MEMFKWIRENKLPFILLIVIVLIFTFVFINTHMMRIDFNIPAISTTTHSISTKTPVPTKEEAEKVVFVGSRKAEKFHKPNCRYVDQINEVNLVTYSSYEDAVKRGKSPCSVCKPTKK